MPGRGLSQCFAVAFHFLMKHFVQNDRQQYIDQFFKNRTKNRNGEDPVEKDDVENKDRKNQRHHKLRTAPYPVLRVEVHLNRGADVPDTIGDEPSTALRRRLKHCARLGNQSRNGRRHRFALLGRCRCSLRLLDFPDHDVGETSDNAAQFDNLLFQSLHALGEVSRRFRRGVRLLFV